MDRDNHSAQGAFFVIEYIGSPFLHLVLFDK